MHDREQYLMDRWPLTVLLAEAVALFVCVPAIVWLAYALVQG